MSPGTSCIKTVDMAPSLVFIKDGDKRTTRIVLADCVGLASLDCIEDFGPNWGQRLKNKGRGDHAAPPPTPRPRKVYKKAS